MTKGNSSIGVSVYKKDVNLSKDLIKKADMAMYQSKNKGGSQYSFFTK